MESREIGVDTPSQPSARDLTSECTGFLADVAGGEDGLLNVFVPHATAGLLVMELGSGSDQDLLDTVAAVLRRDDRWRHRHGSPGHGADHVLPLLAAPSV
ncbi:MAG: YjbQ family protein, partial [Chloroflexota bacterium]|nr:YjbQ family protein [Chloroflexota bacterium]